MPEMTQLRLPGEAEFSWYALDRVVNRSLGCHRCNRRIESDEPHARGDDGERLCSRCVATCERGAAMPANEANRRQRETRIDRAMEAGARMLLDGLAVETIAELKRLVDAARAADRIRGMVRQDAEWARDVLHAGTYRAGGSHPGDRALTYLERIIKRTGDPMAIEGWYYLHDNGDLIYKGAAYTNVADFRESDLVRAFWPVEPDDREKAWSLLVEALAAGANPDKVFALAIQWDCTNEDAREYARRVNVGLVEAEGGWGAYPGDVLVVGESSLASVGATCLEAMAELAKWLGYKPSKMGGASFAQLVQRAVPERITATEALHDRAST